jgi:cytosine/adenosine deaminase-related metal-dependent hydrolase
MDPYDLYDMDEADEEETEEMKKDALAWLQKQGYTRVLHHVAVCALTAILLIDSGVFMTSNIMLLELVARDVL